jgi:hypothetical protein
MVCDIPNFTGNAFNHRITKYTNSIFIRFETRLKGSVANRPRILSFTVCIVCSASLTCSFAAVVLHSTVGIRDLIFSNFQSIKIVLTTNPASSYTSKTCLRCLLRLVAVMTGTCSAVTNFILLATVTKNTSAANVIIFVGLNQCSRHSHIISYYWLWCSSYCLPPNTC